MNQRKVTVNLQNTSDYHNPLKQCTCHIQEMPWKHLLKEMSVDWLQGNESYHPKEKAVFLGSNDKNKQETEKATKSETIILP